SDLKHGLVPRKRQRLGHQPHNVWLADGLAAVDGQRPIGICQMTRSLRHKPLAGHAAHGGQHGGRGEAPPPELPVARPHPRPGKVPGMVHDIPLSAGPRLLASRRRSSLYESLPWTGLFPERTSSLDGARDGATLNATPSNDGRESMWARKRLDIAWSDLAF